MFVNWSSYNKKRGFGLIEILVVTTIISILSSVGAVATKQFRNKAKVAKVQAEIKGIGSEFEVYESGAGGYPNPEPGERKVYCIGSTDCAYKGKAVPTELGLESMPDFAVLDAFNGGEGLTQGYMYMSCGADEDICPPEDTALLFGLPEGDMIDIFDYEGDPYVDYNFFDWGDWGFDEFDWYNYDVYDGESGGNSTSFQCDPDTFPNGSFDIYGPLSTDTPLMASPYCSWNGAMAQYVCSPNSCEASYAEFTDMVNAVYFAPYCGQPPGPQYNPNCIEFAGQTKCKLACD